MGKTSAILSRWDQATARWAGSWTLELIAITFSCLCLAALIATLLVGDGQATWDGITLNTYVSILATAGKLSALFTVSSAIGQAKWNLFSRKPRSLLDFQALDLASRGGWGSVQLLFRRRDVAAVLGALAFIVAFAFDPFAQQLVHLRSHIAFSPGANASFATTSRYDGGMRYDYGPAYVQDSDGSMIRAFAVTADFSMQAAVLSGLVQPLEAIHQQSHTLCSSGNCTWPATTSLAVCSTCQNIPSIEKRIVKDEMPTMSSLTAAIPPFLASISRFHVGKHVFIDNVDGANLSYPNFLHFTAFTTAQPLETVAMKEMDSLILATTFMRVMPDSANESATWPTLPIAATECALYYCVRSYNVSVQDNIINEQSHELATVHRSPYSWQRIDPPKNSSRNSSNASLDWPSEGFIGDRTDLMLGASYNVSQAAVGGTSKFMQETFIHEGNKVEVDSVQNKINGYYMRISDDPQFSPNVMQPLYENDDLDATFEAIAASMSNAMRAHQNGSQNVTGEVGTPATKYRVEWPWITLPLMVVLASLLQLVITMFESRHYPLWKSDVLAVLSRGGYVGDMFVDAETVADMREAASHERVSLLTDIGEPEEEHRKSSASCSDSSLTTLVSDEAGKSTARTIAELMSL